MNYIIIFFQVFSGIVAIISIVRYYVDAIDNGVDNEYGNNALISVFIFFLLSKGITNDSYFENLLIQT